MELDELVSALKALKENENLKFYAYLANAEAKEEIFENGLYLLSKKCNSLFFKLEDNFFENAEEYISDEVGTSTRYGMDTLYLVATSQKRLSMLFRREEQRNENGDQLIKISPTNVIGSLDLNDYYFDQNTESVVQVEKVPTCALKK
jgi:hypothetical protein